MNRSPNLNEMGSLETGNDHHSKEKDRENGCRIKDRVKKKAAQASDNWLHS